MGIAYQRFKAIWPMIERDFCLLQRKIDLDNGAMVAVTLSKQHPECPEVSRCVRAVVHFANLFIFPSGPNTSRLVYFLLLDVKGYIRTFVVNLTLGIQAMLIENLRVYLANSHN